MTNKRLLFVVNDPTFFLSHRLPLGIAARSLGFEVHVATGVGAGIDEITRHGFKHHVLPLQRSGLSVVAEFKLLFALYRLYRNIKPSIVHHVTIKPVIYGGIVSKLMPKIATVNAITGLGYVFTGTSLKHKLLRCVVKPLYRLALSGTKQRTIFQNPDDMQQFINMKCVRSAQVVLIRGSGVDLQEYHPPAQHPEILNVVLPARMLWDKGVAEFVAAARVLKAQFPHVHFQLLGDTDADNPSCIPEEQLRAWVDEGIVEWLGYQHDMIPLYQHACVVCLPSYREGLPKALIEASACGCPIITTDTPGCRETVIDGKSGYLVPLRNSEMIVQKLTQLLKNKNERLQMGIESRKFAEKMFSIDTVVSQTMTIYADLLNID